MKCLLLLIAILLVVSSVTTSASTAKSSTDLESIDALELEEILEENDILIGKEPYVVKHVVEDLPHVEINGGMIRTLNYSKSNVKKTTEWSSFRRISDKISTGSEGGSISSNRITTFGTVASGSYANLGFSLKKSKSSSMGYTLNVSKNYRVYLGYRVKYNVEKGTRITKTGKAVRDRSSYKIKTPIYGEYKWIRY
ncbi:hypothetical protein HXA31_00435 [Salipaludibacillus agaradhaerens]|uniref:Uncharacterized protein n=1 Tax=Salipaludibacillus agaradhaerens TaxID=76935 RepID=A0A9Q4B3K8_SALAG|nr:hypothetical protein [Salipaludibacillus agaradhaerens]MCR6097686.1 hypothetical protein [Salipaludibacillus agaradhaerens]MCR6112830.1 hypothetical protein [Salipaludibacillus agaradhaerens]